MDIGLAELIATGLLLLLSSYIVGYTQTKMFSTPIDNIKKGIDMSFLRIANFLPFMKTAIVQQSSGSFFFSLFMMLPAISIATLGTRVVGYIFSFDKMSAFVGFGWSALVFTIILFSGVGISFGLVKIFNSFIPSAPITPEINNTFANVTTANNSAGGYQLQ